MWEENKMTDTITIAELKKFDTTRAYVCCIQAKVIQVSKIKPGNTNGFPWLKQPLTLQDETGEIEITAWNEKTGKLVLGKTYKICDLGVDEYQGKVAPSIRKITSLEEIKPTVQETIPETIQESVPSTTQDLSERMWAESKIQAEKEKELDDLGRLILAQVFYKKKMDYCIHVNGGHK